MSKYENLFKEIKLAQQRLKGVAERTPLIKSYPLSTDDQEVFIKLENLQRTGSFKIRGAFNKIGSLPEEVRKKGIICSSAGNHAQGVALAGKTFNCPVIACMPETAPQAKIDATLGYGAQIVLSGQVYDDAQDKAHELQKEKGYTYVHAFEDDLVIAGQGTIGLEILEDVKDIDTIVVPIGGGGLIAGITIAAKNINPNIKIIGVQAEGAHAMVESLKKGERVILSAKTLADGIQVKEPGQTPFNILKEYAETLVTVSESEIHNAMIYLFEKHHAIVEGAGAVSVAAFMNGKISKDHKKICLVCSGGNIDIGVFSRLIDRVLLQQKRRVYFDIEIPDHIGELNKLLTIFSSLNTNIYHCVSTRQALSSDLMFQRVNITLEFISHEHEKKVIKAIEDAKYKYHIY
jgi:threonine dehydratase